MLFAMSYLAACSFLLLPIGIAFKFGSGEKEEKIKNITWSVPIPLDLISRLRDFSPLSISRTSGIYLDDVFEILNGTKSKTAPEVIEKLQDTLNKLQERDMKLDREAARMAYLIRGFEALEQKEREQSKEQKVLSDNKSGKVNQ